MSLQCPQKRVLLDLETHGRRDGWPGCCGFHWNPIAKVLGAGTAITATTGDDIVLVNGLAADVVVDYHEQNIRYPGQSHTRTLSPTVCQVCGCCRGRWSSPPPWGLLQTVTSAVRTDVG